MEFGEFEIYKGKTFSALLKEIVVNQNEKKDQLDILIGDLRSLIKSAGDAIMIVPMIKEYFDVSVRNDEQLVKLASIIQKILARQMDTSETTDSFGITEEERKQLMDEVSNLQSPKVGEVVVSKNKDDK